MRKVKKSLLEACHGAILEAADYELEKVMSNINDINTDPKKKLALFEADGGSWQYEAQLRVSKHLKEELTDLIDDGTVVVIG